MTRSHWIAVGAIILSLAACGGGGTEAPSTAVTQLRAIAAVQTQASNPQPASHTDAAAQAVPAITADQFMDWAERTYPDRYPGHQADESMPPLVLRYYAATGNLLAVANGVIYSLGPVTANHVLVLGTLSDFACRVNPAGCVTPPPTDGRLLSVSPSGSTSSDCIASPCKTIQRAESLARPGDTIEVHAGTYGELQVRHWGTSDKWITLRAAAGEQVVIRGAGIGPSIYFYDSLCDEYAPAGSVCPSAYWRIDGVTVQGSRTGQGDGNAIKIDLSDVTITNSKLCCSYADIVKAVRTASRVTLDHNEFWQDATITPISTNAQAVDKTGGSDLKVTNNYFHDIPDVAAYAKGNACRPLIDGNLFFNTGTNRGGSTVMLGQQTDASRLVKGCGATSSPYYESYDGVASNNLVINAVGGCIGVSSSHNARVLNNKCINTGTAGRAAFYLTNESVADPHPGYPNGRQPSDYVEFKGNTVQNVQGRMFSDSDAMAMDDWHNLVIADNLWFATQPLNFTLKNTQLYGGGGYAQWLQVYTQISGRTDNSSTANPNLNADALKSDWLKNFKGQ